MNYEISKGTLAIVPNDLENSLLKSDLKDISLKYDKLREKTLLFNNELYSKTMEKVDILETDTAETLGKKLSLLGADMLLEALDHIEAGNIAKVKQNHSDATFTTKIHKHDCIINWQKSAQQLKCLIMGANPDPVASTMLNDLPVKIYTASIADVKVDGNFVAGEILPISSVKSGVFVKCGSGVLQLKKIQLPGGKVLDATQVLNGRKIKVGDVFEHVVQIEN